MSINVKQNKASALAAVRALIAGTEKHFPNGSLTFGNATYAAASLIQLFQSLVDAMTAHDVADANAKDALLALRDVDTKVGPVLRAYRRFIVAMYGNAAQLLADFGVVPPKARAPMTVEEKAAAAAKLRATRKARGTKGTRQKAAIKGTVTATGTDPALPATVPAKPTPPSA